MLRNERPSSLLVKRDRRSNIRLSAGYSLVTYLLLTYQCRIRLARAKMLGPNSQISSNALAIPITHMALWERPKKLSKPAARAMRAVISFMLVSENQLRLAGVGVKSSVVGSCNRILSKL